MTDFFLFTIIVYTNAGTEEEYLKRKIKNLSEMLRSYGTDLILCSTRRVNA